MAICCALLKHDSENFKLEILEYYEISELLTKEKYWVKLFNSEYNIVNNPTLPPMSGRTHSDAKKIIMSDAKKGENHPNYGKTLSFGAMKLKKNI
jgi:group I intron endonuclease